MNRGNARKLVEFIFPKSIREAIWLWGNNNYWSLWDIWHHVETKRHADQSPLDVIGENLVHACRYEPSFSVRPFIRQLGIDYKQYAFVDFGSGKGRVLLEASEFPFKSVEGVEFSANLHGIAENNIRNYRRAKVRCAVLRSIHADAIDLSLPDTPLVLYLFNPFFGPVLAAVFANIRKSFVAHPRDIVIICAGRSMKKEGLECIPGIQVLERSDYCTTYRLAP